MHTARSSSATIFAIVAAMALFTAIGVVAGLVSFSIEMSSDDFRVAAILMLCASVTLAAPVLTAMLYRPYDVFHPLNFIALSLFLGVFGRTIFLLASDSPAAQEILEGRALSSIIPGAILSAVGSVLLCAGFSVARSTHLKLAPLSRFLGTFDRNGLMEMLPFIFLVSVVGMYLFLQATGFSYSGLDTLSVKRKVLINDVESSMGYHRLLAQDVPRSILLLLVAMWCTGQRKTTMFRMAVLVFGFLAIALPFVASSRSNVVFAIVMVVLVINRAREINFASLSIAVALSLVVIFGMLALRRVNNRGANLGEAITEMGFEPLFGNHSFADVTKLSHIYDAVPDLIPYKYGTSFIGILYAPVPRALWPGKPAMSMGREITEKIYNRGLKLDDKGGGTPPGVFAEAVINFSIYGFPVAMFVLGATLRVIYNTLSNFADQHVIGLAIYGGVIPTYCLNMMGGDFTRSLVQGLAVITIMMFVCLLSRVRIFGRTRSG